MKNESLFFTDKTNIGAQHVPIDSNKFAEGGLIAPNGKPSNLTPEQYKLVRTPEFKAWFGDWENDPENASKVVDENGEPLVVYHGTTKYFTIFNKKYATKNTKVNHGYLGHFFTPNFDLAIDFTKKDWTNPKSPNKSNWFYAMKCFLNIKNPKSTSVRGFTMMNTTKDTQNMLKEYGYDGVIVNKWEDDEKESWITLFGSKGVKEFDYKQFVAFNSNQIKLADGTNTTFDLNSNDIRFQTGGLIAPNGNPSKLTPEQYKLVRTPEFKAWFGDWENDPENASKVVDENGEPLVVYHGSRNKFNQFRTKNQWIKYKDEFGKNQKFFWSTDGSLGEGAYFTNDKDTSLQYTGGSYGEIGENGFLYEVFLNLKKPSKGKIINKKINDGVIGVGGESGIYMAINPNQIKLADGTNTTFDGRNPDIRYKDGGKIKGVTEVVYEDNGDTILIGSKNNKTRVSVKGLSLEQIKEELEFEKDMLRFKKSSVANFSENEIRSQRGMTDKEKLDAIKLNKQSLVEIEKVEKIIIPFYESKLNSFKDGGRIDNERIDCHKCDWSWKVEDGGDDLYVCHKCGYDNAPYYATKFAGGGGIDINEPFNVNGKTLAERVRILLKQLYPDYKWSVTSSYNKLDVYLLEADFEPFTDLFKEQHPDRKYYNINNWDFSEYNRENKAQVTDRALEVFKPIREYIDKFVYNRNANDPYADYSDYNIYEYTYIGKWDKPYVQVAPKAGKRAKTPSTPKVAPTPISPEPKFKVGDIITYRNTGDKKYKVIRFIEFDKEIQENVYNIESLSGKTKGWAKESMMSLVEPNASDNVFTIQNIVSKTQWSDGLKQAMIQDFVNSGYENVTPLIGSDMRETSKNIEKKVDGFASEKNTYLQANMLAEEIHKLLDAGNTPTPSEPPAEQDSFLEYLKSNNEKATFIPRELEMMNALTLFIQSAKDIEGLDADRYANLLANMIGKLRPTE